MEEFVEYELLLDTVGKDGKTLRETCKIVEELEGYTPDELANEPDCPAGFDYLWDWFKRLNGTRQQGFGMSGITETELRSFFLNRKIEPEQWELDLLIRLDKLVVAKANAKKPKDDS